MFNREVLDPLKEAWDVILHFDRVLYSFTYISDVNRAGIILINDESHQ